MRRLVMPTLTGVLLLAVGCGIPRDTKNIGTYGGPLPPMVGYVLVHVPSEMLGSREATWSATWLGGTPPYTIRWNFGGGAANVESVAATSPDIQIATMINPSRYDELHYRYTVTLTDANGSHSAATGSYTIGPTPNSSPVIESARFAGETLEVAVSDEDGDDVTVTIGAVRGLTLARPYTVVVGGDGTAEFIYAADDLLTGGSGTAVVTAEDGWGAVDTAEVEVSLPALELLPDTIYVLPMVQSTQAGEFVTFVCATGELPNPFQYLNGVGVTIEDDANYVTYSFNAGPVGGSAGDVDGEIWTAVSPSGFLQADNLIQAIQPGALNSIPEGRERWSFNLTGLGGSDINGGAGVLFNFQFTFSEPGLKRIGLQAVDGVSRTYYSDGDSNEYFWGTLMADEFGNLNVTGVDNSVLVE